MLGYMHAACAASFVKFEHTHIDTKQMQYNIIHSDPDLRKC